MTQREENPFFLGSHCKMGTVYTHLWCLISHLFVWKWTVIVQHSGTTRKKSQHCTNLVLYSEAFQHLSTTEVSNSFQVSVISVWYLRFHKEAIVSFSESWNMRWHNLGKTLVCHSCVKVTTLVKSFYHLPQSVSVSSRPKSGSQSFFSFLERMFELSNIEFQWRCQRELRIS